MWHRIDRELDLRRERHIAPGSWADIARALDTTEQRVNNWKRRRVPSDQHAPIAAILGWSVDQLLGLAETSAPAGALLAEPPVDLPNWRAVADELAAQLDARRLKVSPTKFLVSVDELARQILEDQSREAAAAVISRYLQGLSLVVSSDA